VISNDNLEQILNQLNHLDAKFEDLRRDLMASFVLKQVFDVAMAARDEQVKDLKYQFEQHRQNEMGKWQRYTLITGGALGIVTSILTLLHSYVHL
jgi:hypothetical protein